MEEVPYYIKPKEKIEASEIPHEDYKIYQQMAKDIIRNDCEFESTELDVLSHFALVLDDVKVAEALLHEYLWYKSDNPDERFEAEFKETREEFMERVING